MNTAAINLINGLENVWLNTVLEEPMWQDVAFDFSIFTEYLPGLGGASRPSTPVS
jgi:hypothetical protein